MDVRFLFVVGYLLLMVGVSLYLKRKMVKSSDDFAVAGRRLPMIVLVGTTRSMSAMRPNRCC